MKRAPLIALIAMSLLLAAPAEAKGSRATIVRGDCSGARPRRQGGRDVYLPCHVPSDPIPS